jgi:signal transduction histidine kinase
MRLSFKITLLLFAVITLFVVLISIYFFSQINKNFTRQSEKLMAQMGILIDQRIDFLKENLQMEMEQLASSIFMENEMTLAAALKDPPDFNTDVVAFAEKLRRHTTLNFLTILTPDGIILSDSLHPAAFGKPDSRLPFPLDRVTYIFDDSARIQYQKRVSFGRHALDLRGGYYLRRKLERLAAPAIQLEISENGTSKETTIDSAGGASDLIRVIELKDDAGNPVLRIRALVSRRELEQQKQDLIRNSSLFIGVAFFACLLTGYLFSLSLSRPLARLQHASEEMSQGRLDVRVKEQGGGETAALIRSFNRMASELDENQKRLLQAERIAAWQEIARHLAHEIKNPLTPIRTSITNLRISMERAPERFHEIFLESSESILEEVEKLRHLADEFSKFARLPPPELKQGNLNEVIQQAVLLYSSAPLRIRFEPGEIRRFRFDQGQISQVIHNLLQNAIDAAGPGGTVKISTGLLPHEETLWASLSVEDNGKGMNEQTRRQIFAPYFTTKEKGGGLGLTIVHRIISEHGGTIDVKSEPGKGTRFEIRLPIT